MSDPSPERDALEICLDRLSKAIFIGVAVLAIALVSVHGARHLDRRVADATRTAQLDPTGAP